MDGWIGWMMMNTTGNKSKQALLFFFLLIIIMIGNRKYNPLLLNKGQGKYRESVKHIERESKPSRDLHFPFLWDKEHD